MLNTLPMPLRQLHHRLVVSTRGRGFTDVSAEVGAWVRASGIASGLLTVFIRHTSASLLVQENADPDVLRDLARFVDDLVPDGDARFTHVSEGPDDMPAHVRAALTATSLGVPVREGRPPWVTWQGLYLWEHRRRPHARELLLHLIGE